MAFLTAIPEPVILGRHEPGGEIYTEPLHALPAPGFHLVNIDEHDTTYLDADHPRRWQVDRVLNYMQDPGVSADVHRLRLSDREDRRALLAELDHCLHAPAQHGLLSPSQRARDASLGGDHARRVNARSTIVERLAAASTVSRIHARLLTVFGAVGFTYPPGLYYARNTPARLGEPVPAAIPVYIPDRTAPLPIPPPNFARTYARVVAQARREREAMVRQLNLYEEGEAAAEYPDADDGNCMHADDDPESL
jgi:hypothetical protein